MRTRHKRWAAPYLADHTDICLEKVAESDPFFDFDPLFLEIGIGKGGFIIGMAKKFKGHYLGLERDLSIAAIAAKKVEAENLDNIRIRAADFDFAYEEIQNLRFDAIYLNFSDPWPKKRHWKRRLTSAIRLKNMALLLEKGGKIIQKTDNLALYEYSLEQIQEAGLEIESATTDYAFDEAHDVQSEYESNFRSLGQPIYRIVITKKGE